MIIPERIIQSALVNGLKYYRSNPKLLAWTFQSLTEPEFDKVVEFITKTSINLSVNFPRKELTPPSITIILKSQSEAETFLGDFMGYGNPPSEIAFDTKDTHAASVSGLSGLPQKVFGPVQISGASSSSVLFENNSTYLEYYKDGDKLGDLTLYVVNGTGKGHTYAIYKINSDSIDITGTFSVPLDNTSVVVVRKSTPALSIGEPARVFSEDALLYRKGANLSVNYDIDIAAGTPEQCIYLSTVVQSIFYATKATLEDQGLQGLTISATDFAPRRDYHPDDVFVRQLNIQFHYSFSVVTEEPVFKELQLYLCNEVNLGTITLD